MRLAAVLLLLCAAPAEQDPNIARDAKLIASVKQMSVHKLDDALPAFAFEKWLQNQSGFGAKYHWEANDCGEQTGSPDETGSVPLCVEVDARLKDGREIVIFVGRDRPPKSKVEEWKIFFAQFTTSHEKIVLRHLSELPGELIKTHPLQDHAEGAN
jgi:hypothetical protein